MNYSFTAKHSDVMFNPLNAELNPICHLLALLGGAIIVVVSRLRVNECRILCGLILNCTPKYGRRD
jgi:uncharacterized membrane protein